MHNYDFLILNYLFSLSSLLIIFFKRKYCPMLAAADYLQLNNFIIIFLEMCVWWLCN